MIGGGLLAAGLHISGIAEKAVLQFLLVRLLQTAQYAVLRRDGDAVLLTQVLRQQGLEKDGSAGAVGDGVEELHGNAVMVHQHPQGAAPHLIEGDVGQRAAFLRLDGRGLGDLLQIVPEHPPPQPHRHGRKAPHRHIQRRAQHCHIHRLRQGGGQAEKVVPVAALGGRVDLGGVIQPHPPQAPGRGEYLIQKMVDGLEVLLHVLGEAVQHIGVPPFRGNVHLAAAAGLQQLLMEHPGVVQHHLVPAHEQQGRRQAVEITEQRGAQGLLRCLGIAPGVEGQQLTGHGGVHIPVGLEGGSGGGKVRPRGDAHQPAGQGPSQLLELQAQGIDEPAAGGLTAQQDLPGGIALFQQIFIALQCILQRSGIGMLRGQPVGGAKHPHAALRGQRGGKALGVFQTAAGIAAPVEVQDHAGAALVLGHDPRPLKIPEVMLTGKGLPPVHGRHQFPQLVLPLPGQLQRAVFRQRLEEIQL